MMRLCFNVQSHPRMLRFSLQIPACISAVLAIRRCLGRTYYFVMPTLLQHWSVRCVVDLFVQTAA